MRNTTFLEFLNHKKNSESMEHNPISHAVVMFGGFIPGGGDAGSMFKEAAEEDQPSWTDVKTVSKSPVLFDQKDADFLAQFPPQFHSQALAWRYGTGLKEAKEGNVKNWDYVPIQGMGKKGKIYFLVNTGIHDLAAKLEKPVGADELGSAKHDDRDKYKGGFHGYDLNDFQHDPEHPEQLIASSYIGMTPKQATQVLSGWRNSIINGWLTPKDADKSKVEYAPIGISGGKRGIEDGEKKSRQYGAKTGAPVQREYVLGLNGQIIKNPMPTKAMMMPVMDPNTLRQLQEATKSASIAVVNNRGQAKWVYYKKDDNDKFVKAGETEYNYVPMMSPGSFVQAGKAAKFNDALTAMRGMIKRAYDISQKAPETRSPEEESFLEKYKQTHADLREHQETAKRYDMYDWAHRHFNYLVDDDGKKLYPRLHTTGHAAVQTMGGNHPHWQQKSSIKGGMDTWKTLEPIIAGNWQGLKSLNRNRQGDFKFDTPWGTRLESPVVAGVKNRISKFGGNERGKLDGMMGDICQDAFLYIRHLMGMPIFKKTAELVNEGKQNPGIWDDKNNRQIFIRACKELNSKADYYAYEVWQYDLGSGTRRKRGRQITQEYDKDDIETGRQAKEAIDANRLSATERIGKAGDDKLAPGGRTKLRQSDISGSGDSGYEIRRGHSINAILELIQAKTKAIKDADAKREQMKDGTYVPSEDEIKQNFQKSWSAHYDIFNQLVDIAIKDQLAQGQPANELKAQQWADTKMDEILNGGSMSAADAGAGQQANVNPDVQDAAKGKIGANQLEILSKAAVDALTDWHGENWEDNNINLPQWTKTLTSLGDPRMLDKLRANPAQLDQIDALVHQKIPDEHVQSRILRLTGKIREMLQGEQPTAMAAKHVATATGQPVAQRPAVQQTQQAVQPQQPNPTTPQRSPLAARLKKKQQEMF